MSLAEIRSLVSLFHSSLDELGEFTSIPLNEAATQVPDEYNQLLSHTNHMTVTMERFYGCSVDVRVMQRLKTATYYAREILLTRQSDRRVVQYGIPRLNLNLVDAAVRQAIESEELPLGRVLIEHNVLREVELAGIWQVRPGPALLRYFELDEPILTYGRTALIRLNNEPAVELLEIAAPVNQNKR